MGRSVRHTSTANGQRGTIGGVLPERAALAVSGFLSSPAFSLLGIFVAWQIFPYFVSPFFDAILKVVHPTEDYF